MYILWIVTRCCERCIKIDFIKIFDYLCQPANGALVCGIPGQNNNCWLALSVIKHEQPIVVPKLILHEIHRASVETIKVYGAGNICVLPSCEH
jgi:hypothetical protein